MAFEHKPWTETQKVSFVAAVVCIVALVVTFIGAGLME